MTEITNPKIKINAYELFLRNVLIEAVEAGANINDFKFLEKIAPKTPNEAKLLNFFQQIDNGELFNNTIAGYIFYYAFFRIKYASYNYKQFITYRNKDFLYYFFLDLNFLYIIYNFVNKTNFEYKNVENLLKPIINISYEYFLLANHIANNLKSLVKSVNYIDKFILLSKLETTKILKKNKEEVLFKQQLNKFIKKWKNFLINFNIDDYNHIFEIIHNSVKSKYTTFESYYNKDIEEDPDFMENDLVFLNKEPYLIYTSTFMTLENIIPNFFIQKLSEYNYSFKDVKKEYDLICKASLFYKQNKENKNFLSNAYIANILINDKIFLKNNPQSLFTEEKLYFLNKIVDDYNLKKISENDFINLLKENLKIDKQFKNKKEFKDYIYKKILNIVNTIYRTPKYHLIIPPNKQYTEEFLQSFTKKIFNLLKEQ